MIALTPDEVDIACGWFEILTDPTVRSRGFQPEPEDMALHAKLGNRLEEDAATRDTKSSSSDAVGPPRGTGLREVSEAVRQANLLRRLEYSSSVACDSACEGRCRECPADAIREAIAILAALSALLPVEEGRQEEIKPLREGEACADRDVAVPRHPVESQS